MLNLTFCASSAPRVIHCLYITPINLSNKTNFPVQSHLLWFSPSCDCNYYSKIILMIEELLLYLVSKKTLGLRSNPDDKQKTWFESLTLVSFYWPPACSRLIAGRPPHSLKPNLTMSKPANLTHQVLIRPSELPYYYCRLVMSIEPVGSPFGPNN